MKLHPKYWCVVFVIGLCHGIILLNSPAVAASPPSPPVNAFQASVDVFHLQELQDWEELAERIEAQRLYFNQITPPGLPLVQSMMPPLLSFNPNTFLLPPGIATTSRYGVTVYPLVVQLDATTRTTGIYSPQAEHLKTIAPAFPLSAYTSFASLDDPSRITLKMDLIARADVEPYLYVESLSVGDTPPSPVPMQTPAPEPDTRFRILDYTELPGQIVRISLTNGTGEAELFACIPSPGETFRGAASQWVCVATNIAFTNNFAVWEGAISNDSPHIFWMASLNMDSDEDGLTDGMERFVYHTDPHEGDTDQDGVTDSQELLDGTDPLDYWDYYIEMTGSITPDPLYPQGNYRVMLMLVDDETSTPLFHSATNAMGEFAFSRFRMTNENTFSNLRIFDDLNNNGILDTNEYFTTWGAWPSDGPTYYPIVISTNRCDADRDSMLDYWEHAMGFNPADPADAWEDPDGDFLYNFQEYLFQTDPYEADPITYAVQDATRAVDSRLAGQTPATAMPVFSTMDHANTNYVRNTNCWAYPYDLTACSPWNSEWGVYKTGTLISPRHVLFAAHLPMETTNNIIRFIDATNGVVERKMIKMKRHPKFSLPTAIADFAVGLLDAPVPTNRIHPAKVLPDNYRYYFDEKYRIPALRMNQYRQATVGDVHYFARLFHGEMSTYFREPIITQRLLFYYLLGNGDSGNPAFIILNNEIILLTVWSRGEYGIGGSITAFKEDINQLMLEVGGTEQLEEFDLSIYDSLP